MPELEVVPQIRKDANVPDWKPQVAPLFLRVLLGATFIYAGLQKLMSPGFFDPRGPASIYAQMSAAAQTSPIHALVAPLVPYSGLVGHAIALGEIGVGAGALIGLFTRPAAIGGAALSVSFWLTVNAHVHPYFFIPDIPWAALWVVLWMLGPGEILASDKYLGLVPEQAPLGPQWSGQRVIPRGQVAPWTGQSAGWDQQPVGPTRRQIGTAALTLVGIGAVVVIALRVMHRWPFAPSAGGSYALPTPGFSPGSDAQASGSSSPSATSSSQPAQPAGQHIGTVAQLNVGGTLKFTHKGNAAVVVHPSQTSYIGLSLVCTHAGCTCNLPAGGRIVCGCHGSVFSASNGAVLQGPASTPLDRITITAANGNLYAS